MNANISEREQILADFGRLVIKEFDRSLRKTRRNLSSRDHPTDVAYHEYIDSLTEEDRKIKIAQDALESFVHDLMAAFDESNTYKINAISSDGEIFDIKTVANDSLHMEQLSWIEDYSENDCISSIVYDMRSANEKKKGPG